MTRRPMIVGESSPIAGAQPLSAIRSGSTGWRLWQMMRLHADVAMDDYHDAFDRRNACKQSWNSMEAANFALMISALSRPGQVVVLLGERVRGAFGVPRGVNPYTLSSGAVVWCVPHPSGLNRWYNDAQNRSDVGKLLATLYERWRQSEVSVVTRIRGGPRGRARA